MKTMKIITVAIIWILVFPACEKRKGAADMETPKKMVDQMARDDHEKTLKAILESRQRVADSMRDVLLRTEGAANIAAATEDLREANEDVRAAQQELDAFLEK